MPSGNRWTLAQLNARVSAFMDDAAHTRWSSTEVDSAIQQALWDAPPLWWEERLDDSHTYDRDTYRYALPPACVSVEEVWFEPLSSTDPRYFVPPTCWHQEGDELVFDKRLRDYDGQTMYLVYLVWPTNLLTVNNTNGVVSSGDLDALTSSGATFVTSGVRAGDSVELAQGTFYVKSVDSETQITVHKNMTAGASLTYHIARYTDLPVMYVVYYAAANLYEKAGRNRPGLEVDEYIKWSTYYHQMAQKALRDQRKAHAPRRRY